MCAVFLRRFSWINLPAALLVALLQRSPVLRLAALAEEGLALSKSGAVLRSAIGTIASLGAMHSLAGATQVVVSANPGRGTVGTPITPVSFAVTGAPTIAGSYRIVSGTLPPGLVLAGVQANGFVNATTASIIGTPTAAGSYSVYVRCWEFANGQGDAFPALPGYLLNFEITGGSGTPPAIASLSSSQSVNPGSSLTLTVTATGTAPLTYQWTKDGTAVSGATSASLALTNIQSANAGRYAVVVTNAGGSVTSSAITISVNSAPTISSQPASQIVAIGGNATLSVSAAGTAPISYQWRRNGVAIAGATAASLTIANAQLANAGNYDVVVTNSAGSATSTAAILNVGPTNRLNNVSVRTTLAAEQIMIVGVTVQGGAKPILVRAVGPGLAPHGVSGFMPDPRIRLFDGAGVEMANNDNWGGGTTLANAMSAVGAFPIAGTGLDAALIRNVQSGQTVHVSGPAAGNVLVEGYDAGTGNDIRLTNVSARNFVGVGADIMIAGFALEGSGNKNILIRAVGPGLAQYGVTAVLADPKLQVFNGSGVKVAENDNYDPALATVFTSVGAFALNPGGKDSAMVVNLPSPGTYTVQVSGADGGTGNAIVELYELP